MNHTAISNRIIVDKLFPAPQPDTKPTVPDDCEAIITVYVKAEVDAGASIKLMLKGI
jgi:hypothetical protein